MVIFRKYKGVFSSKRLDSHLNFHGKEHHLCPGQYLPQSPKAAGIISWRNGGPRHIEIQVRHDLDLRGCSRGILLINFYTGQASGSYQ